ncbi:MAG: hypothetical protein HYR62_03030 [Actinobacteria bacterium]|nr:hypothetical protein [Actinomycetota bacterium]MBI3686109.1 hypothetical protein [Actinomycetota bacterium]
MTTDTAQSASTRSWSAVVNGRGHRTAMNIFMAIVIAHWAEHIAQAIQIWALGWPRPRALGLLGMAFPWLVSSEWLHYGFALVMLGGLWLLRAGFHGRATRWWVIALGIQVWHHLEHFLLLVQAQTHHYLFGASVPTSIIQQFLPRVELHLFYNALVTVPMAVAVVLHLRPNAGERAVARCTCAVGRRVQPVGA